MSLLLFALLLCLFYVVIVIACFEFLDVLCDIMNELEMTRGTRWKFKLYLTYVLTFMMLIPLFPFIMVSYLWGVAIGDDDDLKE